MKSFRFPLCAATLGVAVLLSSCATDPKPAIVMQVEAAKTPVQAVEVAVPNFFNMVESLEKQAALINSPEELNKAISEMTDATQACEVACRRMLTVDSVTPAEDAQLKKMFNTLFEEKRDTKRLGMILLHKAELHAVESTYYKAQQALYWLGRLEETTAKLSRKPVLVR